MKKFSFTLQTLHDLRQLTQRRAEADLAEAGVTVREAMERLEAARRRLEQETEFYKKMFQSGQLDQRRAALRMEYLQTMERQMAEAEREFLEAQRLYTLRQIAVVKASMATEITDKLRDAQLRRYHLQRAREEQLMLDEMAILRVAGKQCEQNRQRSQDADFIF